MNISPTKKQTPARILIHGQHKIGKSTWASCAPAPVFIPTEDGLDDIDETAEHAIRAGMFEALKAAIAACRTINDIECADRGHIDAIRALIDAHGLKK